jgi:hypothetical protein
MNKPISPATTGNFSAIGQPPVAQLADHPTADVNWPRPVTKLPVAASSNTAVKGPPVVAQLPTESNAAQIWQRAVAQLAWVHNAVLNSVMRISYTFRVDNTVISDNLLAAYPPSLWCKPSSNVAGFSCSQPK